MIKTGAPSYLLMIDSLISKDPENETLLFTAAMLYIAYADLFVKDTDRSKKMAQKALNYATQAICLEKKMRAGLNQKPLKILKKSFQR